MLTFFRTVVEKLEIVGICVMTKGVWFELLWFQSFLTWDETCPVLF